MEALRPDPSPSVLACDVYVGSTFVGVLSGDPAGNDVSFTYDQDYAKTQIPLGPDLPLSQLVHTGQGLPPFFRHYIAEGPTREIYQSLISPESPAQVNELNLFMNFPYEFFGALRVFPHVEQPGVSSASQLGTDRRIAAINSAMFPGWRPKLLAYQDPEGSFYLSTGPLEESTHIIKYPSEDDQVNRVLNEYLAMRVIGRLLPDDRVTDVSLGDVVGLEDDVLRIKRFDRHLKKGAVEKIDFREFAQLLGYPPEKKDQGYFREMADFIYDHLPLPSGEGDVRNVAGDGFFTHKDDVEILYKRVCAFFLIGNGDAHLKNFGLVRQNDGTWRLSPVYDVETSSVYNKNVDLMALGVGPIRGLNIHKFEAKHLVHLAQDFRLEPERALACINDIRSNIDRALEFPLSGMRGDQEMRSKISAFMEKQRGALDGFEAELNNWVRKGKYDIPIASRPPKKRPAPFAKFYNPGRG